MKELTSLLPGDNQSIVESFILHCRKSMSAASCKTYRSYMSIFLTYLDGKLILETDKHDIVGLKQWLLNKVSVESTRNVLSCVKRLYRYNASLGIHPDVAEEIKIPRKEDGVTKLPVGREGVIKCLKYLKDKLERFQPGSIRYESTFRDYVMFYTFVSTGWRVMSLVSVRVQDIREHKGRMVAYHKLKGRSDRELSPISPKVVELIEEYRSIKKVNNPQGYIFTNPKTGEALKRESISSIIRKIYLNVGIITKDVRYTVTAHSLRYDAAIRVMKKNGLEGAKRKLHHLSSSTTQIYTKPERFNRLREYWLNMDVYFAKPEGYVPRKFANQ